MFSSLNEQRYIKQHQILRGINADFANFQTMWEENKDLLKESAILDVTNAYFLWGNQKFNKKVQMNEQNK